MRLTSSMQPTSTSRCPWKGSSPVVSVSSTISRIPRLQPAPKEKAESPAPFGHCSNGVENRTDLGAGGIEALRGIHDKIGAAAFFSVRHLLSEDRFELFHGHAGALERTHPLHLRGCRYHHHGIDPSVAAALEQ